MKAYKYIKEKWEGWPYKNTILLLSSLVFFFFFYKNLIVQQAISYIGGWGYVGAFLAGILFVSVFSIAPAIAIIYSLAQTFNPFDVAILAGAGAVLGDYLIFRFLKDNVFEEVKPLFSKLKGTFIGRLFKSPLFIWFIPVLGAAIIASPLPDEVGLGLIGMSKVKNWQFVLISFLLNATGIFIIVTVAKSF